jgi:hypothetical protein
MRDRRLNQTNMGVPPAFQQASALFLSLQHGRKRDPVKGGIEVIAPSFVSGWVFCPDSLDVEVHMRVGHHLIAKTSVGVPRPDVEIFLGVKGDFGFVLAIPDDFPLIDLLGVPTIVAVVGSNSRRYKLRHLALGQDGVSFLETSFSAKYRGLRGHFDGLSLCKTLLTGWCFKLRSASLECTVYLHGLSPDPIPLLCDQYRSDLEVRGFFAQCGFSFRLDSCSSLSSLPWGEVWVSFDQAGVLRLPQGRPCILTTNPHDS